MDVCVRTIVYAVHEERAARRRSAERRIIPLHVLADREPALLVLARGRRIRRVARRRRHLAVARERVHRRREVVRRGVAQVRRPVVVRRQEGRQRGRGPALVVDGHPGVGRAERRAGLQAGRLGGGCDRRGGGSILSGVGGREGVGEGCWSQDGQGDGCWPEHD